jgi:hypothetical protein
MHMRHLLAVGLFGILGAVTPASASNAPAGDHRVLPFIADDYTKAVAEARARQVPIFIESWAPW